MGSKETTKDEIVVILKNFIDEKGDEWDWDDFISVPIQDNYLDLVRLRCAGLKEEFPPENNLGFCNEKGIEIIKKYINELSQ